MSRLFTRPVRNWTLSSRAPVARHTSGRRSVRLRLQDLEERATPATFLVKNTNDSGADSLRQAILNANAAAGADEIVFDTSGVFATPQTINISSTLTITDDLTITGPGKDNLTIDGGGNVRDLDSTAKNLTLTGFTVKGGHSGSNDWGGGLRAGGNVTVDHMLFTGNTATGAAFITAGAAIGINPGGFLTVRASTISGNSAAHGGAGIFCRYGGALVVEDSTISGNSVTDTGTYTGYYGGGGIFVVGPASATPPAGFVPGTMVIRNSTIANNSAVGTGGGIMGVLFRGTLLVENSTISGNTAQKTGNDPGGETYGGGGIGMVANNYGGGFGQVTVVNSIVSGNTNNSAPDIAVTQSANVSYSAIGDKTGFTYTGSHNLIGKTLLLGSLADNGGPTQTMLPQATSPLIDAGSNALLPSGEFSDQRGFGYVRRFNGTVDIGAVEVQPPGLPIAISNPPNVGNSNVGETTYTFDVTYADPTGTNQGIDVLSITNNANTAIRVTGPNGFDQLATLVGVDDLTNGTPRVATYSITPPGGAWDGPDSGFYTVSVEPNTVKDISGNAVVDGSIATITVAITQTFVVTNDNDSGAGSLRAAVLQANAAIGDDVIVFDPGFFNTARTISLQSALPQFPSTGGALTVTGPGMTQLTVQRDPAAATDFRIIDSKAPDLKLSGFTITGGTGAYIAGASAGGPTSFDDMAVVGNASTPASVGGVYIADGQSLVISNSVISNNTTAGIGGGIWVGVGSDLTLINSTVSNNTANSGTGGGGIFVNSQGSATIIDSTISGNSATGGSGGGIFVFFGGNVTLQNSTVSGNQAKFSGGGIYFFDNGSLLMDGSTISGNTASAYGGYGNFGGGGVYFFGTASSMVVRNSTIANNSSAGSGGGILLSGFNGQLQVQNSTISGNSAALSANDYPTYGGGGIGVYSGTGSVAVTNSIIAGNVNATSPDIMSAGTVATSFSAIGSLAGFTDSDGTGDLAAGIDLKLGPLADNGGPTQTMSPQVGSPLIDAGSNALVPVDTTTDQRGLGRVYGGAVDIGSVEIHPPTVTINQEAGQPDPTNEDTILFDVVFSVPVTGFDASDIDFTGSTVGGTLTAAVAQTGPTTYQVAVFGMDGDGTVVASIDADAAADVTSGVGNLPSTSVDNTVTFDNVSPTATINQAGGQNDPTNAPFINFDVVFSEPVTGFTDPLTDVDLSASMNGGAGLTTTITPIDASHYTVSVSGMNGDGTVVASIPAGSVEDLAGNESVASTSTDNSVRFDNIPPTVTINGATDPVGGLSVSFNVLFDEPVTGFDASDIDLSASTAPGTLVASVSGTGPAYTVTVTGMTASGQVIASIPGAVVTDLAGNPNDPSTSTDNSVTYIHSGVLQFSPVAYSVSEQGSPTVTIKVRRTDGQDGPLSVHYSTGTAGDTATAGSDYVSKSDTLTWGDGDTTDQFFDVQILDDAVFEGGAAAPGETFGITLSDVSLAGAIGAQSTATVTIKDFEEGTFSFSQPVYNTSEEAPPGPVPGTVRIFVTRTLGTDGPADVNFATSDGAFPGAKAGLDYTATSGTLHFADGQTSGFFDVPILDDTTNEGKENIALTLSIPDGSPPGELLGAASADVAIAPSDGFVLKALPKQNVFAFGDSDGDRVTVTLGGGTKKGASAPTATVYLTDPDGDGNGPIELVTLQNTDPTRTSLTVKVKKPKVPKGTVPPVTDLRVTLGSIVKDPTAVNPVGLKSINAPAADLNGDGIAIDGYIGSVRLGNVSNGADIVTTGGTAAQKAKTTIKLGVVGDGTTVSVANPLGSLSATSFGDGAITAPYAGSIRTAGRPANLKKNDLGDPGDFKADVTLSGDGLLIEPGSIPRIPTLASLKVKGNILGSKIEVTKGKVNSVSASAFRDSRLFIGYDGADDGSGAFNATGSLGSFSTKGAKDSFQNSYIISTDIRSVSLRSVDTGNPAGVIANQSIGLVTAKSPPFKYTTSVNGNSESFGKFEVKIITGGGHARQSAVAVPEAGPNGYLAPDGLASAINAGAAAEIQRPGTPVVRADVGAATGSDLPAPAASPAVPSPGAGAAVASEGSSPVEQTNDSGWALRSLKWSLAGAHHRHNFLGETVPPGDQSLTFPGLGYSANLLVAGLTAGRISK